MGRTSKNSEEGSGTTTRRKSRSKAKKDDIVQSSTVKPSKQQKHHKDKIRSLPVSIQKSLVRVRESESQGPSPTPESDLFYQQNSKPSGLKFKNPNFQVGKFYDVFTSHLCILLSSQPSKGTKRNYGKT